MQTSTRSKVAGGLLGIFLGTFGAQRFYMGYTTHGVIYLVVSLGLMLPTCFWSTAIISIVGLVEGIIILSGGMKDVEGRELSS